MADYQFSDSDHLQNLYAIHQRNLARLDEQLAKSRGTTRNDLENQAADERAAMLAIVAELGRRGEPLRANVAPQKINVPPPVPTPMPPVAPTLEDLFSRAFQAHIKGNFYESKRLYKKILSIDPFYPKVDELLALIEKEIIRSSIRYRQTLHKLDHKIYYKLGIILIFILILPYTVWYISFKDKSIHENMEFISSGQFTMGNNFDDNISNSYPSRTIYVSSFWIDTYEVNNEMYQVFIDKTKIKAPDHWKNGRFSDGKANHPVVGISWNEANEYCHSVNKRLPTEAEWEKAARGIQGFIWPWGNLWDDSKANTFEGEVNDTKPIGSYKSGNSPYGVADMSGNVWEWVLDWYDEDYYNQAINADPQGPINGKYKVVRGGSFVEGKEMATTFHRLGIYPPDYPFDSSEQREVPTAYIGFRCASSDDN